MILHIFSNKIAIRLCQELKIPSDQVPVYAYGFELLIAALINIAFMAIVSFLLGPPSAWLLFLLAFIPLRVTAGGYHANTHLNCTIVCIIAFALSITFAKYCPVTIKPILNISFCILNLITVLLFSPVEATQKPLDETQKDINRKRALILSILFFIVCPIGLLSHLKSSAFLFYLGVFTASVSQIAGKIQTEKERRMKNDQAPHHGA